MAEAVSWTPYETSAPTRRRVMKESSWKEQESLDRRLAELNEERFQLAARLEAAQGEAEAASREAALQRRLARRLQQRPTAVVEEGEASKQMVGGVRGCAGCLGVCWVRLREGERGHWCLSKWPWDGARGFCAFSMLAA
jgi:hypothetical protein